MEGLWMSTARPHAQRTGREGGEHVDVLVVGAVISGSGAARYLAVDHPRKRVAVLEGRERVGVTWDLFRYPGIRSE